LAGYIVESKSEDGDEWKEVARTSDSLSVTVSCLLPAKTYSFRVRAVNIHGASEPSNASEPFILINTSPISIGTPKHVSLENGDAFKTRYYFPSKD